MRYTDYQKLALRTNNPKDIYLNPPAFQLLHGVMGICTEVGEVFENQLAENPANMIEEIGDTFWYIAISCDAISFNMEDLSDARPEQSPYEGLVIWSGKIMDSLKRALAYGAEIDEEEVMTMLSHLVANLKLLASDNDLEIEEILELNIEKLRRRFPHGFTQEQALNRNLNNEGNVFN